MPSWVEIDLVVLEKKVFKCHQCIFAIHNLPLVRSMTLPLIEFESHFPTLVLFIFIEGGSLNLPVLRLFC